MDGIVPSVSPVSVYIQSVERRDGDLDYDFFAFRVRPTGDSQSTFPSHFALTRDTHGGL